MISKTSLFSPSPSTDLPAYMIDNILLRIRKTLSIGLLVFFACYAASFIQHNVPSFPNTASRIIVVPESQSKPKLPLLSHPEPKSSNLETKITRTGRQFARSFANEDTAIALTGIATQKQSPYWWCTQEPYDRSCKNETHQLCNPKGLLFVKTPKTGSTTVSRIIKRIVKKVAQRQELDICQHREDHVNGAGKWYASRIREESFMLASIRDPAERAISRYFWSYVTRHSNETTEVQSSDQFILNYLNTSTSIASGCTSKGQGGYQLNYITMQNMPEWSAWKPQNPTQIINAKQTEEYVVQLLRNYDFIVLNERMEESLVILQLLLGLETGDIVSLSYNVGGSYRYQNGRCVRLIKSHISHGIREYLQSDEWYAKNYGDYLLHAAVNKSIDMTIDSLGRDRVEEALQEFRRVEARVNEICNERVLFPCSADGTVLFHTSQPVPHDKINQCIDDVVRLNKQEQSEHVQIPVVR